MRKKNVNERRKVALQNLEKRKFTPKSVKTGKFVKGKPEMVDRSEENWNIKKDYDVEILKKRIQS
ncbi:MAG: hypothetical protein CMA64_10775 [Euryarchaeota archaeon]|nr:hypothetical protein [Euryarchaeota archaeon]